MTIVVWPIFLVFGDLMLLVMSAVTSRPAIATQIVSVGSTFGDSRPQNVSVGMMRILALGSVVT